MCSTVFISEDHVFSNVYINSNNVFHVLTPIMRNLDCH